MTTNTRNEAVKICKDLLDDKLVFEAKILPSLTTPCSKSQQSKLEKWTSKVLTIFTVDKQMKHALSNRLNLIGPDYHGLGQEIDFQNA